MRRAASILLAAVLVASLNPASSCAGPAMPDEGATRLPEEEVMGPPSLRMTAGNQSVTGLRYTLSWPFPGETRKVTEPQVWPRSRYLLLAQVGDGIAMTLAGSRDAPATARIEVFPDYVFGGAVSKESLHTSEISSFAMTEDGPSFTWTVPESLRGYRSRDLESIPRFAVRVVARWHDASGREVVYLGALGIVESGSLEEVSAAVLGFFRAAWSHDVSTLDLMTDPDTLRRRDAGQAEEEVASPFFVELARPKSYLAWQAEGYEFTLAGEPFVGFETGWTYGGRLWHAVLVFPVVVREAGTGEPAVWDFEENYGLRRTQSGWKVSSMHRSGTPRAFREPAEEALEETPGTDLEPGWPVTSRVRQDGVLEVGRFEWLGQVEWSDDGVVLAFAAINGPRTELWSVNRDGSGLKRLMALRDIPDAGIHLDDQTIFLLGWAPGRHKKIWFTAGGTQVTGPYVEDTGFWVGEMDAETGQTRDIAFIRTSVTWPTSVWVTEDRTHVLLHIGEDLWRVNLETGEKKLMVTGIAKSMILRHSPSGWFAACTSSTSKLAIHDLRLAEKVEVSFPAPFRGFYEGWAPDGSVVASIAEQGEVVGDEFPRPEGAVALRLYDASGNLKGEMEAPGRQDGNRIAKWAWSPGGKMLAVSVGILVPSRLGSENQETRAVMAKEVWLWREGEPQWERILEADNLVMPDGTYRQISELNWSPDGSHLEVWFDYFQGEEAIDQSGLRVSPEGPIEPISRPVEQRYYGKDYPVGKLGERTCFKNVSSNTGRVFLRDAAGKETVVVEGQIDVEMATIERDALLVITDGYLYVTEGE